MFLRICMALVGASFSFLACVVLKNHGLGIYERDTWIIVVATSLASLLIVHSVSGGGRKPVK